MSCTCVNRVRVRLTVVEVVLLLALEETLAIDEVRDSFVEEAGIVRVTRADLTHWSEVANILSTQ